MKFENYTPILMKTYNDIQCNGFDSNNYNILIVTATEVETKCFHEVMPESIMRTVIGDYTYYLGRVGQYNVINVQCLQMGSINPGGSSQTINAALRAWNSIRVVIMVGICFGFDDTRQHIGDVIVSSSIKNYETRRVGKDTEIPRGQAYQVDKCLLNAFNNLKISWENIGIDNERKKLVIGEYISGEQLVDNKNVRDKLLAETPEAKAGEMEGNGLVAACQSARIPWILVKAICDFADGNKGEDKNYRQRVAATSSSCCCAAALEQLKAFDGLGVQQADEKPQKSKKDSYDVLFELYKKEFAPYFVKRSIDIEVEAYLNLHSMWIYGVSGVGKSTSISHALLSNGRKVLLLNMAGIPINCSTEDIFEWIYNEVAAVVGEKSIAPGSYQQCVKRIIEMLDVHYAGQSVYVLVEELPFSGEVFKNFVYSFSSLIISDKLSGTSADVHFVLSSIDNPIPFVPHHLQKIKSVMKFLEFGLWSDQECNDLIDMIVNNLTVPNVLNRSDLIAKCGNLPRPIKSIFREAYQAGLTGDIDLDVVSRLIMRI